MEKHGKLYTAVLHGIRDGIPIGLGYFAVSFSLGIAAHNAGMNVVQGFFMSLLNNASAGEYAGISAFAAGATYAEVALLILIANARYLLMSTALSQKFSPDTPLIHKLLIGFDVTDELFGLAIAYPGDIYPPYMYGAFSMALPGWAVGTALGIVAGDLLPANIVMALSAAIYGMFIAIIIPPGRKQKNVLITVLISFAASYASVMFPLIKGLSESFRVILLTVVISSAAAIICPVKAEKEDEAK